MEIKTAAIFLNRGKAHSADIDAAAQEAFNHFGITSYILEYHSKPEDIKPETDLILCIGGDGTMLKAARAAAGRGIKILGINGGSLGFLTAAEQQQNFKPIIKALLHDEFEPQKRILLSVTIMRGGVQVFEGSALNEFVIKTCQARAMTLSASYDEQEIKEFFGDGVIVATPTGSTAYNMAAGGPIAYPSLDAFILTPICPHTLAQRPLVLPAERQLTIRVNPRKQGIAMIASLDGQINFTPQYGDIITITKSPKDIFILYPKHYGFFDALTSKLKWGSR